jgi:hypothetical protein
MNSEIHLFILWQTALEQEQAIIADMQCHFSILASYQIQWSPEKFSENLSRFYGQKLPSGSQKEKQCGRGAFLLVLVRDEKPQQGERSTSAGNELVNTNMFDAKERYRALTGGGHRVHGTNSEKETEHDLALLLGKTTREYTNLSASNTSKSLQQDLQGAHGWDSLNQLLFILNHTCSYVILRNFEGFPDRYTLEQHDDIDLLAKDYKDLIFITNAKKIFKKSYRRHYSVSIGGNAIAFDFRHINDDYYDKSWQEDILAERAFSENGFYHPNTRHYFYSLLYHALVHKPFLAEDYRRRLIKLAQLSNYATTAELKDFTSAKKLLDTFMQNNSYRYTEPKDISVFLNQRASNIYNISLARRLNLLRRKTATFIRSVRSLGAD